MTEQWIKNIQACREIIRSNHGPQLVNVVSGSPSDQDFWQGQLERTRLDVFRQDGGTQVISSLEKSRKGNFLGSINAWMGMAGALDLDHLPPMMLMNMVFGQGKRLSPFTQALANRKPAFPTPLRSADQHTYLTTADVAAMSASLWLHHLEAGGFRGIVVKWGDEAIFPGKGWSVQPDQYQDVDAIRFVWQTEPTEDLAREKEWVEYDPATARMTFQYTRQGLESLRHRLGGGDQGRCVGVNLGSLAVSYPLMQVLEQVFRQDVSDERQWVDWDPYTWIALSCESEAEWAAEAAREQQMGKTALRDLETRLPGFFSKIQQVKASFQSRFGKRISIHVLDFGQPYWMDWGLHLSLRRSLESLTMDGELGAATRQLFAIPEKPDHRGNILVRSRVPAGADIRDAVLIDTVITDPASVLRGGLVVAGRHRRLCMPQGGCALFCAADEMKFAAAHAIAFMVTGREISLSEGDRLASLYLTGETIPLRTNESLVNYEGENYTSPVMGNPISFEEAARRMSAEDTRLVDKRWSDLWSSWLD